MSQARRSFLCGLSTTTSESKKQKQPQVPPRCPSTNFSNVYIVDGGRDTRSRSKNVTTSNSSGKTTAKSTGGECPSKQSSIGGGKARAEVPVKSGGKSKSDKSSKKEKRSRSSGRGEVATSPVKPRSASATSVAEKEKEKGMAPKDKEDDDNGLSDSKMAKLRSLPEGSLLTAPPPTPPQNLPTATTVVDLRMDHPASLTATPLLLHLIKLVRRYFWPNTCDLPKLFSLRNMKQSLQTIYVSASCFKFCCTVTVYFALYIIMTATGNWKIVLQAQMQSFYLIPFMSELL